MILLWLVVGFPLLLCLTLAAIPLFIAWPPLMLVAFIAFFIWKMTPILAQLAGTKTMSVLATLFQIVLVGLSWAYLIHNGLVIAALLGWLFFEVCKQASRCRCNQ